jgi:hypothetical protein
MTSTSFATPIERHTRNPGYGLAALVAIAGFVIAIGYAAVGIYDAWRAPDDFDRTPVGSPISLNLAVGQEVVAYFEGPRAAPVPDAAVHVSSPTGGAITISPYDGVLQYDRADGLATAVARFTAPVAGAYVVSTDRAGPGWLLAVGSDIGGRAADRLAGAGIMLALTFTLTTLIALGGAALGRR